MGSRSPRSWGEGQHCGDGGGGGAGDDAVRKVAHWRGSDEKWRICLVRAATEALSDPASVPSGAAFTVVSSSVPNPSRYDPNQVRIPTAVGPVLDSGTAAAEPAGRSALPGRDAARQRPVRHETDPHRNERDF